MTILDEIESNGRWLFRWRGYIPVLLPALAALAMLIGRVAGKLQVPDYAWEEVCLGISGLGLAVRAFAIGHTPAGTSGRNAREQRAVELNTSGIYSVVRHPLYLGNFFLMLGVILFAESLWLTVFFVLSFWLYYERIMAAEESFLKQVFGARFEAWARTTPAFVPRFSQWRPSDLHFSLKNVLRREYNGFFAVFLSMFILDVARNIALHGRVEADSRWTILLGLAMSIWLVLRSLKRYTSLLRVAGR
jgi:protein-S-isoprenylcysteine O-methyltransferase Ste14